MATCLLSMKKVVDNTHDYLVHQNIREFPNLCKIVSYCLGSKSGEKAFGSVFDFFNVLDFADNVRDWGVYVSKRLVPHDGITVLLSDTINNTCDSLMWLNSVNILALGALSNSLGLVGGITLAYSFANRTYTEIKNLSSMSTYNLENIKEPLLKIAKNASICAIGVILALCNWYGWPIMTGAITALSAMALVAGVAIHNLGAYKQG